MSLRTRIAATQADLILLLYDIVRLYPEVGVAFATASEELIQSLLAFTIAADSTNDQLTVRYLFTVTTTTTAITCASSLRLCCVEMHRALQRDTATVAHTVATGITHAYMFV